VVPRDARTIQAAVRLANPGDVVLLQPGTYAGTVRVPKDRGRITIRGVDRNSVVFDGEDVRPFAVLIEADHVSIENFTAHNFTANAIEWENVEGFDGRFLTVWNVGGYGVYAVGSRDGRLDHSLVSGAGNSAFYIGECQPCRTVLTDLEARLSGIGYSGTNAGGGLVVRDSLWIRNGTGLLPNSFNEERHAPQRGAVFMRNRIAGSGTVPVPATDPLDGFSGLGIGIAGGQENVVTRNVVVGSARYGIALFPTLQRGGGTWAPAGNSIGRNTVRENPLADLALSTGSGRLNCFGTNRFGRSLPPRIEQRLPCGSPSQSQLGDSSVAQQLAVPAPVAYARSGTHPSYRDMPPPPPQPTMPR
jgi:Right handed beta helix region